MKKIIAFLLMTVMVFSCAAALISCGSEEEETTEALVLATNANLPPYSYKNGSSYTGIDIEIAKEIAKKLGRTLEIVSVTNDEIIAGIQNDTYDFGMAKLNITPELQAEVNFSDPYADGVQVIVVRKDSAITKLEDVFTYTDGTPSGLTTNKDILNADDFKVGVATGSVAEKYASMSYSANGFNFCDEAGNVLINNVDSCENDATVVEKLIAGDVEMAIVDSVAAATLVAANADDIKILEGDAYASESYGICVSKKNEALLKDINGALAEMKNTGAITKIINKYTSPETETEGDGDNTNTPRPTLVMATNAYFKPYEYYDGNKIVGIDAEIAAAIADYLGYDLVIEDMEFDSIITAVKSGSVDFGMAGMTITEDRLKDVNFSISYATGVQSIIVRADSDIKSVDDLYAEGANYKIGVQLGTTGDIYAVDDFGAENVTQYPNANNAVIALAKGDIDCVIIDNEPAKALVAENEGLQILDTSYADEDYAICVSKDNAELLELIDNAILVLTFDGVIDEIVAKYIN